MGISILSVKLQEHPSRGMMSGGEYTSVTLNIEEEGYSPKPGDGVAEISETLNIHITGADSAAIQATIKTINTMLQLARMRKKTGIGHRIYLMVEANAGTWWWGSEVLEGRVFLTEGGVEGGLSNGRAEARLSLTRVGYFESIGENYLPISNSNGTTTSAGTFVNLFNCMDLSGSSPNKLDNHVEVAIANIAGDLPAPIQFEFKNITAGTLKRMYVGRTLGWYANAVWLPPLYQDQSGAADAACSGGAYASASISTDNETDLFTITWGDVFAYLGGDLYHVMARFRNNTSLANVRFRLKLVSGSVVIWSGPLAPLTTTDIIQDLGVVNLPPGDPTMWSSLSLVISGKRTTAATETIQLDFVQIIGREFAKLEYLTPLAQNEDTLFGGDLKSRYRRGTVKAMDIVVYGAESLTVIPGMVNAFFFLAQTATANTAEINRKLSIRASYHPRRSTI